MVYAVIKNGVCVEVKQVSGQIDATDHIEIESTGDYMARTYIDGIWGDKVVEQITEPHQTVEQQMEELKQQNLILMDAIATLYEELQAIKAGGVA